MSERSFVTETGTIFYEVIEASAPRQEPAPALVLLHNFMSSGRAAWGPLLDALRVHWRILLPDLPGHGQSIGHPAGFNHRHIARQLAAWLEAEQASQAHLAGCSSGGMLAQLLVAEGLMQPRTLTLVSTTHSTNPATSGHAGQLEPADFKAAPNWMEATARLHDPYHYEGYYEDVILAGFRRLRPETAIDLSLTALASFAMPTCIIHGAADEFFPPAVAQRMAATMPDAELHLIPRQSHALLFRQPWRVAQIMVEFLDKHQ